MSDWRVYLIYALLAGLLSDQVSCRQAKKTGGAHHVGHFFAAMFIGWAVMPIALTWGLLKAMQKMVRG